MKAKADPNLIVYFDGQYMPLRDAQVSILTHALHYGTGVFEGIRAHWDRPSRRAVHPAAARALRALEEELRHSAHRCSGYDRGAVAPSRSN